MAKRMKKEETKIETEKQKGPGVIETFKTLLNKKSVTIDEAVTYLTEKFPEREPLKMKATFRTQLSRLKAKRDDKGKYTLKGTK